MGRKSIVKNFEENQENSQKRLKFFNIDKKKHKFNGKKLFEYIDFEILQKLIKSKLLKKTFHSPFADHYYDNEREQLIAYSKLVKKGKAEIIYKMKEGIDFGRVNPDKGLGLFNIRREIRQTLSKNSYVDIDVENCHPVILLQICKKNKIPTNYLNQYVVNRDKILQQVKDK